MNPRIETRDELAAALAALDAWQDGYRGDGRPLAPAYSDALRSLGRAMWIAGRDWAREQADADAAAAVEREAESRDRVETAARRARSQYR